MINYKKLLWDIRCFKTHSDTDLKMIFNLVKQMT